MKKFEIGDIVFVSKAEDDLNKFINTYSKYLDEELATN